MPDIPEKNDALLPCDALDNGVPVDPSEMKGVSKLKQASLDDTFESCESSKQANSKGEWFLAVRVGDSQTVDKPADGPCGFNSFKWNGFRQEVQPIVWRLIKVMWNQQPKNVTDVIEAVWQSDEKSDSAIKRAIHRANRLFDTCSAPFSMHYKRGKVILRDKREN